MWHMLQPYWNSISTIVVGVVITLLIFRCQKNISSKFDESLEKFKSELQNKLDHQNAVLSHINSISLVRDQTIAEHKIKAISKAWTYFNDQIVHLLSLSTMLCHLDINKSKARRDDPNYIKTIKQAICGVAGFEFIPDNSLSGTAYVFKQLSKKHTAKYLYDLEIWLPVRIWDLYLAFLALNNYLSLFLMSLEMKELDDALPNVETTTLSALTKVFGKESMLKSFSLANGEALAYYKALKLLLCDETKKELKQYTKANTVDIESSLQVSKLVKSAFNDQAYGGTPELLEVLNNLPGDIKSHHKAG